MLAVLLVEVNHLVAIDRLLGCVWGERVPPRARNSLHTYVSGLRGALSALDGVHLVRHSGGYRLTADEREVDLHRFRGLVADARAADDERAVELFERALGLWRGEPVADLETPWAHGLRATLERERLAAELDHADAALRRGRHAELLPDLVERARRHPLDERVAAQLVLALYRSGRQADALEHHRRVRARLVDELGADPGPGLQRLHQQILAADPELAGPAAPTPGAPPAPRQLPAPPRLFTGRAEELAVLTKALDSAAGRPATVVISALAGAGGIGKIWLALHWAHHHLDRFPDGQLFVDLHGFSPTGRPKTPGDALCGFLAALGVAPDRVPADPDAQAALFRSLVADRRVLVVLDNAATTDQVVPLLPGTASCTVLVTSRNRLHGLGARHGARPLPLGVLPDTEARALLVAALGAELVAADEAAVADLIALCGGFPLALGLVAARVQQGLPPAEAVAELRESGPDALDDDDPAASLPAVLSWSLRRLTDTQRTAFALLGTAPGPDTGLPAAGLLGLPAGRARAVLRALADASLLDRSPDGRCALHDLVRAYAAGLAHDLPEPVRRAAAERVVDFYLHTAHAADRLLNAHAPPVLPEPPAPGASPLPLPDRPAALAWLDAEHRHLLAAQHTAADVGRHRAAWHFARVLTWFHLRRGHLRESLGVWQAALEAAAHLPDPAARIQAHRNVGGAQSALGRHEEAVAHLDRAIALAEHHGDTLHLAHNHHALAEARERLGQDDEALAHALRALVLIRALGDNPVWEAWALNAVGWHATRLRRYDTAREHCEAALARYQEHRDPAGEAATLDSLGLIDHLTGHHERAVRDCYEPAIALVRAVGHTYELSDTLDRIGHPHVALGRPDRARAAWREALELYRQQGRDADARRVRDQLDGLERGSGRAAPTAG